MMKKLFALILLAGSYATINAQEVFTEIKNMAQRQIDAPGTSTVVKDMNRFKVDALNYLGMKMKEQMPDSSATYLDNQAYALHNFIILYTKTMKMRVNEPKNAQLANIKMFIDASIENPLFANKEDLDYVMSYVKNASSPIRFSLDTNWVKAYLVVADRLKKK